jgi:hypothetical protein
VRRAYTERAGFWQALFEGFFVGAVNMSMLTSVPAYLKPFLIGPTTL